MQFLYRSSVLLFPARGYEYYYVSWLCCVCAVRGLLVYGCQWCDGLCWTESACTPPRVCNFVCKNSKRVIEHVLGHEVSESLL